MAFFRESSILTLQYSVGVAKLSVEQGFLVLRVSAVEGCPLSGVPL